jgi:hypothetical protein
VSPLGISLDKPIDQGTGIIFSMVAKGKEKENLSDFHSLHSRLRIIQDNKNGITVRITMETRCRPDAFMLYPISTAEVTWSMEESDCQMMNTDLALKWRTIINGRRRFKIGVV